MDVEQNEKSAKHDSIDDSIDIAALDHEIDKDLGWADDSTKPKPKKARRSRDYWQKIAWGFSPATPFGQFIRKVSKGFTNVVFFPVFSPFSHRKEFDIDGKMTVVKRSIFWRIVDGIVMRALLAPVIMGIFLMLLVWLTTHPSQVRAEKSPQASEMTYRDVELRSNDGKKLAAWYIPPVSADDVNFSGGRVVNQKWPAVVVCHGLGSTHDQYLDLATKLHDAGFAVLMLDTRGQGGSESTAVTFGLDERFDIIAGVKFLRDLPQVDGTKICVVGKDIAGAAALHAAAIDSSIAAVVADGVWPSFDMKVKDIFDTPSFPSKWMSPLYQMTFDMMMRQRSSDLNLKGVARGLTRTPVLYLGYNGPGHAPVEDVRALSEETSSPHQAVISEASAEGGDELNSRVTEFFTQTTRWVSPRKQIQKEIQNIRRNQVK
jgi:pimeloyl-ACP methyl ester carboxylesterase